MLLPAVAHAGACPKLTATVDKPEAILDFHQAQPDGGALEGGKLRFPGHFYEARADVVLDLKGNEYKISKFAIFKFSCYGRSRSDKNLKPTVDLLRGTVKVKTVAGDPGGVVTEEGLYDPRQDETMKFTVTRKLTSKRALELDGRMAWFANLASQPKGTTTVFSNIGGPIVGVTPYVGKNPGTCRYVHRARLTTTTRYGKGTAIYHS